MNLLLLGLKKRHRKQISSEELKALENAYEFSFFRDYAYYRKHGDKALDNFVLDAKKRAEFIMNAKDDSYRYVICSVFKSRRYSHQEKIRLAKIISDTPNSSYLGYIKIAALDFPSIDTEVAIKSVEMISQAQNKEYAECIFEVVIDEILIDKDLSLEAAQIVKQSPTSEHARSVSYFLTNYDGDDFDVAFESARYLNSVAEEALGETEDILLDEELGEANLQTQVASIINKTRSDERKEVLYDLLLHHSSLDDSEFLRAFEMVFEAKTDKQASLIADFLRSKIAMEQELKFLGAEIIQASPSEEHAQLVAILLKHCIANHIDIGIEGAYVLNEVPSKEQAGYALELFMLNYRHDKNKLSKEETLHIGKLISNISDITVAEAIKQTAEKYKDNPEQALEECNALYACVMLDPFLESSKQAPKMLLKENSQVQGEEKGKKNGGTYDKKGIN